MKTLTWQKPGQQNVAQELIKIIINYVAELRFINNYRKTVRDQTFVDQTDNLFHLNLPQDSGFDSTEGAYDLKEIHRIVNALPKDYRVPFAMYVSGFKYREIAENWDFRWEQ